MTPVLQVTLIAPIPEQLAFNKMKEASKVLEQAKAIVENGRAEAPPLAVEMPTTARHRDLLEVVLVIAHPSSSSSGGGGTA